MARRRPSKAKETRRSAPRRLDKRDAGMKKWDKPEDIPLDEEDQFHASRDKVLIGDEAEDSDVYEDEVFALQGLPSDDSDEDDDEDDGGKDNKEASDAITSGKALRPSQSGTQKSKSIPKPPESESGSDVDDVDGWGSKKSAYYSSNAAQLESDDDEANEMEEQEARRLQAKMRTHLSESDFGLDRLSLESNQRNDINRLLDDVHTYTPVAIPIQDKRSLIRHLEKTNPESLALAFEWDDVVQATLDSEKKIAQSERDGNGDLGMLHLYRDALLTYASLVAFYLHLRSNPKYAANPEVLRKHPIMSRLLVLKKSISFLEDIQSASLEVDGSEAESGDDFDSEEDLLRSLDAFDGDLSELKALLSQTKQPLPATKVKKTDSMKQANKKRKKKKPSPSITYDLEEPDFNSSRPVAAQKDSISNSNAYGELTALNAMDVEDKSSHRKSLRFHASKIESTSLRRQNARKAMGGDDDIPYRERKREAAKKQKTGELGQGGDDLDDSEPSPREAGSKRPRSSDDISESSSDDDESGYYSLIKKQKSEKKKAKQAAYDLFREASRPEIETEDVDGQRSVTRAILANKGLTPRRSKSVRNPRVKKRQRFEKAKKKISSQKAVYKGGIGDAHSYGGEQSGISKVVKSVKL